MIFFIFFIFYREKTLRIILTLCCLLLLLLLIIMFVLMIHLIILLLDILKTCKWLLYVLTVETECFPFTRLVVALRARWPMTRSKVICVLATWSLRPSVIKNHTICLRIKQLVYGCLVRRLSWQKCARARWLNLKLLILEQLWWLLGYSLM